MAIPTLNAAVNAGSNVTNTISDSINNVNWANVLMGVPGIGDLILLGKAIGIAVLVYITFLIIRSITGILYSLRFKRVAKNVEEINQKMDILISKTEGKKLQKVENKKNK